MSEFEAINTICDYKKPVPTKKVLNDLVKRNSICKMSMLSPAVSLPISRDNSDYENSPFGESGKLSVLRGT